MFWILMYTLLFGGPQVPELTLVPQEKAITQTITDNTRLQEIMSIRDEMASQEIALASFMREQYGELITITRNHDADYDRFRALLEQIDQEQKTFQQTLIKNRFRLKELMSREEWQAVFKKK